MQHLIFSNNPNGKLFPDVFGDIRLADYEKFQAGNMLEIYLKKQALGRAMVVGHKDFSFIRMTDATAKINSGYGTAGQATILRRYYPNITECTTMMYVTLEWKVRYMDEQEALFKDWWQQKITQHPTISSYHQQEKNLYL